jgi:hypothetical protein
MINLGKVSEETKKAPPVTEPNGAGSFIPQVQ